MAGHFLGNFSVVCFVRFRCLLCFDTVACWYMISSSAAASGDYPLLLSSSSFCAVSCWYSFVLAINSYLLFATFLSCTELCFLWLRFLLIVRLGLGHDCVNTCTTLRALIFRCGPYPALMACVDVTALPSSSLSPSDNRISDSSGTQQARRM